MSTDTDDTLSTLALLCAPELPEQRSTVQAFATGATRNRDEHKYDFEGFLSPSVLERYGQYMHSHRLQSDGTLRDSDNWQKGIPLGKYVKSLVRHTFDCWRCWRLGCQPVIDKDSGKPVTIEDLCCAIMFNVMGFLHEWLKKATA
jgi:hypothetical protein